MDPELEVNPADLVEVRKELIGAMTRHEVIDFDAARSEADENCYTFSFSSEVAVERGFGDEVLSHAPAAVDLSRLNNSAPLLWNHNPDEMIGVVDKAWVEGGRGYVTVRFGSSARAQQVLADVRAKIIRNVSVGYRILQIAESKLNGRPTLTATRWRPSEVSIVSVPADQTVGLGRSEEETRREVPVLGIPETRKEAPKVDPVNTPVDANAVRAEAITAERDRAAAIRSLASKVGNTDLGESLVNNGTSLDAARAAFLEVIASRAAPVVEGAANLDLSDKEQRSYSLIRAINAQVSGDWKNAGFERECSIAIANRAGRETAGFFMPMNVRMGDEDSVRAAYAVGAAGTGGNLVATELLASSFIDLIRNRAVVAQLGARFLSGLVGNVAIPRQITGSTAYWVAEAAAVTESEGTFDLVTLSPKTLGARSQMTRQMLMQGTPDIEALARADLATTIALAIDLAATAGTGSSGQPTGILNTAGIGSVVGGTNGAALTIDHLIDLETQITQDNADMGNMSYLTNAKAVGKLKKAVSSTGQYLWTNTVGGGRGATPGEINGYGVARSNQITSTGTKGTASGVCSTVLFGNFADLIIGEWGVLEVLANPYGSGYTSGSVDIRAMQSVDMAVRHAESFSAMTDALTT